MISSGIGKSSRGGEIDAARPGKQACAMERMGLTREIAAFAARAGMVSVPPEAIAAARRAVIDTVGVTLAGRNEAAVRILRKTLRGTGPCLDWSSGTTRPAHEAALINGTSGHVLDYDDVAQGGHPSVVIVPAVFAAAQQADASGRAMLEACVIGYEVWGELVGREPDAFHLGSWHPTAVLGTIAATAAVCALGRLSPETSANALAIAASMAAGVIANFGSHTKPLQAGRAAANAVLAVELAVAGMTGAADALEGGHGLLRGISPRGNVDTSSRAGLAEMGWRLLRDGLSVKRYPVCYASHRVVDAVIRLAAEHRLRTEQVRAIVVTLGEAPARTLRYADPKDGLEARFSMNHNLAAALRDGTLGFAQLTDDYVRRPDVTALYGLTRMEIGGGPCPEQPGMAKFDEVVIELADGSRAESGPIRYAKGHARDPLSDAELRAKFLDCAAHAEVENAADLLDRLGRLDTLASIKGIAL
jgi:aconitate decarboxylase